MLRFACVGVAFGFLAVVAACSSGGGTTCTPGINRACICGGTTPGTQSCGASGSWGSCSCDSESDAGMHDAALMDAHLDAGSDQGMALDSTVTDSGAVDAAAVRAEVLATIPSLAVATVQTGGGGTALPDFSCRRAWDQDPAGGSPFDGVIAFDYGGNFGTSFDIKVFRSNDIPYDQTCTGTCTTTVMSGGGTTGTFSLEPRRFTAWSSPAWTASFGTNYVPSANYFYWSENFVPYDLRTTVPAVEEMQTFYDNNGLVYDSNSSTLTASLWDCDNKLVKSAVVRVFDEVGLRDVESYPLIRYGSLYDSGALPAASTAESGGIVAYGMDPSDLRGTPMRIEAWANLGTGTPELVACERVRFFGGVLVTMALRPIRTNSPSDCTP